MICVKLIPALFYYSKNKKNNQPTKHSIKVSGQGIRLATILALALQEQTDGSYLNMQQWHPQQIVLKLATVQLLRKEIIYFCPSDFLEANSHPFPDSIVRDYKYRRGKVHFDYCVFASDLWEASTRRFRELHGAHSVSRL